MPRSHAEDPAKHLRSLFAKNLRLARIAVGLSQEGLADQADLDRTFVSSVERTARNISIDNIQRLAEAVGFSPHALLNPAFASEHQLDESVTRVPRSSPTHKVFTKNRRSKKFSA